MNAAVSIEGQFGRMTGVQFYVDSLLDAFAQNSGGHHVSAFMPLVWSPGLWGDVVRDGQFAWLGQPGLPLAVGASPYLSLRPRVACRPVLKALAQIWDAKVARRVQSRTRWLSEQQARRAARGFDLLHTPGLARLESADYAARRNVATIYDLTTITHAWAHQPENIAMSERHYAYAKHKCDRILTISHATKADIIEYLGIPASRIDVTPLAPRLGTRRIADPDVVRSLLAPLGLADTPFALYAGTLEPRKNLHRLLSAWAQIVKQEHLADHRLVLAGGAWRGHDQLLRDHAQAEGILDKVVFAGYVSNELMNALMSACRAFAYVSEYEGFGIPPLEAMACGAPVVASNASSLPEVVGAAALSVAPHDTDAIAAALHLLLTDDRENAARRVLSVARAAEFTWQRTAALTLASYEAAVA